MFGKLKAQIFGTRSTAAQPFAEPPLLVLARRERRVSDDWFSAKSYLGGLPKLGETAWPRDDKGAPLYFMGQLDCAEINSASSGQSALPRSGALAFFIGGSKRGAIVHLAAPGKSFTPAPEGRAKAEEVGIDTLIDSKLRHHPHEAPFWPVDFHLIRPAVPHVWGACDDDDETILRAQCDAIEAALGTREFNLSAKEVCQKASLDDVPLYWLSALMFAERVPLMSEQVVKARARGEGYVATASARLAALDAGDPPPEGQGPWRDRDKDRSDAVNWIASGQAIIARADANQPAVADYVSRVKAFMPDIDPWRMISPNDAARLDTVFDEARSKAFEDFSRFLLPRSWRDYATDAIKIMAAGPDEAFSKLPPALRTALHQHYRLPSGAAHLMFGLGSNLQGNEKFEHADQRLVLQLTHDDLLYWSFGDNGVYQFWMSTQDLAAGDFTKADVTFECH